MVSDVDKPFFACLDTCISPNLSCSPPRGVGFLRLGDDLSACGITGAGTTALESANRGRFAGLSTVQPISSHALRIS